jgi:hypothetical protein
MQRYTVTVVAPGTTDARPVLLVPFRPDALVTTFIDELYRRIAKQGLAITPNTHIATLHIDSEVRKLMGKGIPRNTWAPRGISPGARDTFLPISA